MRFLRLNLLLTLLALSACAPAAPVAVTAPATPIPQPTPELPGAWPGLQEIADPPGEAYPWARWTRTPRLAIHPRTGTPLVAWLSWNTGGASDYAGDVWVRLQDAATSVWERAQTINSAPISKFYGGLGTAITPDGTAVVAYGHGGFHGNTDIAVVERHTTDEVWSAPTTVPVRGRVVDLLADADGGLHLLVITPESQGGDAVVGYRAPGRTTWQMETDLPGPMPQHAALALLETATARTRVVLLVRGSQVVLARGRVGQPWQATALPTNKHFPNETIVATSLVAAARPTGDLIAAAWSQIPGPGWARGGVFAAVSLDGGASWSGEEVIAQHVGDGRLDPLGGFDPTVVYDASTDMLVASWVEDDITKRSTNGGMHVRTLVSARRLGGDHAWRFARTPANGHEPIPELASWGYCGWLYSTLDGTRAWLLVLERRNGQEQILAKPLNLSFLFAEGAS